jgi:hypothetical protein
LAIWLRPALRVPRLAFLALGEVLVALVVFIAYPLVWYPCRLSGHPVMAAPKLKATKMLDK